VTTLLVHAAICASRESGAVVVRTLLTVEEGFDVMIGSIFFASPKL
jgi:hypothetical protein